MSCSLHKYSGVWFEIESYPDMINEFDICVSLSYLVQTDGVLQVVSSWFNTRYFSFLIYF
jgi:lipocalin